MKKLEKSLLLECECVQGCHVLKFECIPEVDSIYLGSYPKRGHKSHGATMNREQARELKEWLEAFLNE